MALSYDQISALTERYFYPKFVEGVYGSNALIARLSRPGKKLMIPGGEKITMAIAASKPVSGGWFQDFSPLDTTPQDNISAVEFVWKQLNQNVKVSRLQELKNSGDAAKLKLVASKMQLAEKQMKEDLATGLFSDGTAATGSLTALQLTGLRAILSTSSTYGGVAVADLPEWVAIVDNGASVNRPLSLNLMQSVQGQVSYDSDKPSVITANQRVVDELWALMQPHQRLMSKEMSGLGFENVLTFNGIPVLVDSHQEANTMYYLNEEYLQLAVHSSEDMRMDKLTLLETQAASVARIFWAGNLVCNNRNRQGKLAYISVQS
jgi:hypothetical protein